MNDGRVEYWIVEIGKALVAIRAILVTITVLLGCALGILIGWTILELI